MNCRRALEAAQEILLTNAADAAPGRGPAPADAPPQALAELERHLDGCAACRAQVQELRALRARLRQLGGRRAPQHLASRTMSALRLEQRRSPRLRRARVQVRRALAATAAAAAVVLGGLYWLGHRSQMPVAQADVAPLVMEYTDFRAAQFLGDRDGMALIRAHVNQQSPRPEQRR